jgi:hypothetical protein
MPTACLNCFCREKQKIQDEIMNDIRVLEQRIQEVMDSLVGAIARDGDIGGLVNVPHTATGVRGDFDGTQMGTSDTGIGLGGSTGPRNYTKRLVIS